MQPSKLLSTFILAGLTAATTVIAIILTAKLVGPLPLAVNQVVTQKNETFMVTGESSIDTTPDEAELRLGITVIKPTVAEAQDEANTIINTIAEELQKIGVKKEQLKTENYSIYPEFNTVETLPAEDRVALPFPQPPVRSPGQSITSYRVNASLVITITDFTILNQAIDLATTQGANQVGGVTFMLSEEREEELTKQARKEAIEDAQTNAKELANLAGMKLGKVINVSEGGNFGYPISFSARAESKIGDASEPTSIEPGSTSFRYSVTVSYETL